MRIRGERRGARAHRHAAGRLEFLRRRGKVTAGVVATALAAGLTAAGAGAAAQASTSQPTSGGPLDVVVGKTVALTTDQKGNPSPFNLMLINGQVSGQGKGQVQIPTGPNTTKTVDVNNSAGQVGSIFALGGSYTGQLPVTISTQLKVNGKQVDPDRGYNLTGDAEITYTFTNHTARKQAVTFKDVFGNERKKEVEVPVPFGNSFAVTFGDGWGVTDAGSMTPQTTPSGTKLSSDVILFPIVPGLVGGTTQTLTVKARADNASLPSVKNTMVPVRLDQYQKGLVLEVAPAIQKQALAPLDSALNSVTGNVASVASLISGYTGGFESLATNHIDPLVAQIDQVHVSDKGLESKLGALGNGLENLGALMGANAAAQDRVARLIQAFANGLGINATQLVKWLGKVVGQMGPAARQAAKALAAMKAAIDADKLSTLSANTAVVRGACADIAPLSAYYGYDAILFGGKGAKVLREAVRDAAPREFPIPRTKKPWYDSLKGLQDKLNAESVGTLPPHAIVPLIDILPVGKAVKDALKAPACKTIGDLSANVIVPYVANTWAAIEPSIDRVVAGLNALAAFAGSAAAKKAYNGALKDLQALSRILSNDRCTVRDVIDPIIAAIKQYGAANIKPHIMAVLERIFSTCGLAQIITFFGDFDRLLGIAMGKLGDIVTAAKADVPMIVGGVDKVKGIADVVGSAFDSIPGLGAEVASLIVGADSTIESKGEGGIDKISNYVGELGATFEAMDQRVLAGDGAAYGGATGVPDVQTYAAYQITMTAAEPNTRNWATAGTLAVIFLVLGAGVGTVLYRRRRRASGGAIGAGR